MINDHINWMYWKLSVAIFIFTVDEDARERAWKKKCPWMIISFLLLFFFSFFFFHSIERGVWREGGWGVAGKMAQNHLHLCGLCSKFANKIKDAICNQNMNFHSNTNNMFVWKHKYMKKKITKWFMFTFVDEWHNIIPEMDVQQNGTFEIYENLSFCKCKSKLFVWETHIT